MKGTLYWLKLAMAQRRVHRVRAAMAQRAYDLDSRSHFNMLMLMRAQEASRGSRIGTRRLTRQWVAEQARPELDAQAEAQFHPTARFVDGADAIEVTHTPDGGARVVATHAGRGCVAIVALSPMQAASLAALLAEPTSAACEHSR